MTTGSPQTAADSERNSTDLFAAACATDPPGGADGSDSAAQADGRPTVALALIWSGVGLAVLWTVVGNLTIWATLSRSRRLRSASNYLVANLAVSDFLLGLAVLPLSGTYDVLQYWPFGREACVAWLLADVLLCTASIWSLLVIAADRYSATFYPHWYRGRRWQRRVALYVAAVWTASVLTSVPPALGLGDSMDSAYTELAPGRHGCILFQNVDYVIYSSCLTFYVPSAALLAIYARIFAEIHRRSRLARGAGGGSGCGDRSSPRDERRLRKDNRLSNAAAAAAASKTAATAVRRGDVGAAAAAAAAADDGCRELLVDGGDSAGHGEASARAQVPLAFPESFNDLCAVAVAAPKTTTTTESSSSTSDPYSYSEVDRAAPFMSPAKLTLISLAEASVGDDDGGGRLSSQRSTTATSSPSFGKKWSRRKHAESAHGSGYSCARRRYEVREQRATKVMVTIVICFIACWLPFFVVYTIRSLCAACVSAGVQTFVIWLGYANSALNPVLYSAFNQEFRDILKRRWLASSCCRRRRRREASS